VKSTENAEHDKETIETRKDRAANAVGRQKEKGRYARESRE